MEKQYENHCQSIYKGKSEEEIKEAFNEKWVEILKTYTLKKTESSGGNACKKTDEHVIINTTNQHCSANLEKRGAEQS